MKKLLKPGEILLLTIAGFLDIFQEIKDPAGILNNYYQNFYGFVPERWKKRNLYEIIRRSLKTKEIEKIEKDGRVFFQVTDRGARKIGQKFSLLRLQEKKWDGKWRFVIFDIEEVARAQRNWLRKKLKHLGFGMVQKSVWLSCHDLLADLREFFEVKGLKDKILLIETEKLDISDIKEFANDIWRLKELNEKYEEIYNKLNELNSFDHLKSEKIINKFNVLYQSFIELVLRDPFLPTEFLPDDWFYKKSLLMVKKIKQKILEGNNK